MSSKQSLFRHTPGPYRIKLNSECCIIHVESGNAKSEGIIYIYPNTIICGTVVYLPKLVSVDHEGDNIKIKYDREISSGKVTIGSDDYYFELFFEYYHELTRRVRFRTGNINANMFTKDKIVNANSDIPDELFNDTIMVRPCIGQNIKG